MAAVKTLEELIDVLKYVYARLRCPSVRKRNQKRMTKRGVIERLEARLALTSDWQNPLIRVDVNDDGYATAIDALVVINALNRANSGITVDFSAPVGSQPYIDANGDLHLTAIDALVVINYLKRQTNDTVVDLWLETDSGMSADDRITNRGGIVGSIPSLVGVGGEVITRVDRGEVVRAPVGQDGMFRFDAATFSVDGSLNAKVVLESPNPSTLKSLRFTLDRAAPKGSRFAIVPADDSGHSDRDGITKVKKPRLQVSAEAGSVGLIKVGSEIVHQGELNVSVVQPLQELADGNYAITVIATDIAGNTSETLLPGLVIDSTKPSRPDAWLALTSQASEASPSVTSDARVTLVGTAEPNSFVSIYDGVHVARTAGNGVFRIPSVALDIGTTVVDLIVEDLAGNQSDGQASFTRVPPSLNGNAVLEWNQVLLNAIRLDATSPPLATRAMAMMSVAILDTVNAIESTPTYLVSLPSPTTISTQAAIVSAADTILRYLYPAQASIFDAAKTTSLNVVAEGPAKSNGIDFGKAVAEAVIAIRSRDGWDRFIDYQPKGSVGSWQQSAPMYEVGILPQWGDVAPFGVIDPEALVPNGPPSLTSVEYAEAFEQVKSLGARESSTRTSEQTQIARFWSDGGGTYTPPGHWNKIANEVALSSGLSLGESARLFAMLNIALSDASIVSWKTKYEKEFWRPITAIQQASDDGNSQTAADATWAPLLITPAHPE